MSEATNQSHLNLDDLPVTSTVLDEPEDTTPKCPCGSTGMRQVGFVKNDGIVEIETICESCGLVTYTKAKTGTSWIASSGCIQHAGSTGALN